MKFYRTAENGLVQLVGTQAEAKKVSKTLVVEEVPTDKDGLLEYINRLERQKFDATLLRAREPSTEQSHAQRVLAQMDAPPTHKASLNPDDVNEFILDSESYVFSNIFAAVMERVERMKKEKPNVV